MNCRKILYCLWLLFFTVSLPAYADLAPLNPEFTRWKKQRTKFQASSNSVGPHATGYRPGPVNLTHLADNPPVITADATFPVSYDLRKLGRVTPIRDQETWETCWAFALLASVESNYLTRTLKGELDGRLGNSETLDLSELHMAWFARNHPNKSCNFIHGVAHIVEDLPENLGIYQHDPLGWCSALGAEGFKTAWAANIFRMTTNGEEIESIAFYTTDNNAKVDWYIYNLGTAKPAEAPYYSASAPSRQGTATFPYAGYHTVKLPQRLAIPKGNYFTVMVKITNANYGYPIGVEVRVDNYSNFANVHDGESWFSFDGADWWDGTRNMAYPINDKTTLQHVPVNACIKAFTLDTDMTDNNFSERDSADVSILGMPVKSYISDVFSVADYNSVKDAPVDNIVLTVGDKDMMPLPEGMQLKFYLVNRNVEHGFTLSYDDRNLDGKVMGFLTTTDKMDFKSLFYPGYKPDEFWKAANGLEFPVYGPFVETVFVENTDEESQVYLNVNELSYADSTDISGAVPQGYYDFVYLTDDGTGSVSIRLNATEIPNDDKGDNDDNDNNDTPSPVIMSSRSGGCNSGKSLAGLAVLGFAVLCRKFSR